MRPSEAKGPPPYLRWIESRDRLGRRGLPTRRPSRSLTRTRISRGSFFAASPSGPNEERAALTNFLSRKFSPVAGRSEFLVAKSASKQAAADAARTIPPNHRFTMNGPNSGTLSADNARLLKEYWERAKTAFELELQLADDRQKLLTDGYEMTLSAVVQAGRELRERHRDLTDRAHAVVLSKWELCKILLPDFRRIHEELGTELEAIVEGSLGEIYALGINPRAWGSPRSRPFILKILPFLNEKSELRDALQRFQAATEEVSTISSWAELADRPVQSATKLIWPAPVNDQEKLIGQLAGVEVAPTYLPVERHAKVVPSPSQSLPGSHFRLVRV